ncbi:hypothetical protein [Paracraurococcus lichenis]|uniref:Tetratricopeptide repeat protein n=1 Tax=Paracraurococcus lichenis TaxID=3064888 RepID=A0ABT9E6J7_9PROT|nr:hypothetical protein [Paracraurococcus sp. LOR1-02]MDO9711749.1 hypothetical protein [Paracraurococcus sp. LOR1-02]
MTSSLPCGALAVLTMLTVLRAATAAAQPTPDATPPLPATTLEQRGAAAEAPGDQPAPVATEAVTLLLPGTAGATLRQEGREALLAFPRALPPIDAPGLMARAAGLLDGVSLGYDTLLLTLAPEVTLTLEPGRDGLQLRLVRAPGTASASPTDEPAARSAATDAGQSLRLRLLAAQLLVQTGRLSEARTEFAALRGEMPDSPEPLAGGAAIEQRTGRWRQALALYQQALLLDPGEPANIAALAALERVVAPRLRADLEYRETQGGVGTGRASATVGGLSGQQRFGEGWRLGLVTEIAGVTAAQVQRRDGTVGPFSGERQRGELFLQYDALAGQVVVGSLFLGDTALGAGLRAELPDSSGVTALRAEYRRPNWDFFQSMINYGTRDRLAVGRRQQLISNLSGRLEVGVNRYGVAGDRDVTATTSLAGELRLGEIGGLRGLSAAYILDAEYLLRQDERTGPDGQRFTPLQIVSREVHALTLGYARTWGASPAEGMANLELSGGYGVDRYGKAGPLLAGSVGYVRGRFELRLRGSYVENIGRARGTTSVFGGALTWYF